MPVPRLFDEKTGLLLSDGELRTMAANAGIDGERPVIVYLGGGMSACSAFMALRVIGVDNARVYDGSWNEWSVDPSLRKERHDES